MDEKLIQVGKQIGGFLMQALATYIIEEASKKIGSVINDRVEKLLQSDKYAIEIGNKNEGYL